MNKFNGIKITKADILASESKIHQWLLKNRAGYNAEKWANPIENYTFPGQFTLPLPIEKDSILTADELLAVMDGPLTSDWFPPETIM